MNYYISDLHLFHKNIIRLANRPFKDVNEMHKTIMTNWNNKVKENDTVYIIGDISFGGADTDMILSKLNGRKVLIKGNHDNRRSKFISDTHQYLKINDGDKQIILFHYPILEWDGFYKGYIHLYGHVHDKTPKMPDNAYNVSCEVSNYTPRTLNEIIGG